MLCSWAKTKGKVSPGAWSPAAATKASAVAFSVHNSFLKTLGNTTMYFSLQKGAGKPSP